MYIYVGDSWSYFLSSNITPWWALTLASPALVHFDLDCRSDARQLASPVYSRLPIAALQAILDYG